MSNKEKTLYKLVLSFFKLEVRKGHLRWSVTDLAKTSGVSRSLVYRYLGNTKNAMVLSCIRCFTHEFYGFSITDIKEFEARFSANVVAARERLVEYHDAIIFYQKWRSRKSWIRDEFVEIETQFQARLKVLFPNFNDKQIILVHAVLHGLVTAPFIDPQQARITVAELSSAFRKTE